MPRTNRPPAYRLHKARICAVVTIGGRNHYLGAYGSAEAYEGYAQLIAEWNANGKGPIPTQNGQKNEQPGTADLTVSGGSRPNGNCASLIAFGRPSVVPREAE